MNFEELGKIIEDKSSVKICEICGTPFTPYHSRQKTCGTNECKKESHKQYMRNRLETASPDKAEQIRIKKREANKRWRDKRRWLKKREEQMSEIIEKTERQMKFDEFVKEHGHEYGKYQMQKTLAEVPKIDVNSVIATHREEEDDNGKV